MLDLKNCTADMEQESLEILLIGPENSGKSYLVKCLQKKIGNSASSLPVLSSSQIPTTGANESKSVEMTTNALVDDPPLNLLPYVLDESTAATIGVDIVDFSLDGQNFKIKELGGSLVSGWHSYYKKSSAVIYMVDIADPGAWPPGMVYLYETITYEELENKPFLIFLNKSDLTDSITIKTGINIMAIDEIVTERAKTRRLVGSCFESSTIDGVVAWIRELIHLKAEK